MMKAQVSTTVLPTLFSFKGNQTQPLEWISTESFRRQQKHLQLMAGDYRTPVQVLNHLEVQYKDLKSLVHFSKVKKASHSLTSKLELSLLAEDGRFEISFALAQNHHSSHKLLNKLATHFDSRIRLAVAQNERTSYATLHLMAQSAKKRHLQAEDIQLAIVQHPAIAVGTLEILHKSEFRKVRKLAKKVLKQRF